RRFRPTPEQLTTTSRLPDNPARADRSTESGARDSAAERARPERCRRRHRRARAGDCPSASGRGTWGDRDEATAGVADGGRPAAGCETWVKNAMALEQGGDGFVIGAANTFAREWLDPRLRKEIEVALGRVLGRPVALRVSVEEKRRAPPRQRWPASAGGG